MVTKDSAKKLVYLAIRQASEKWTMPIRNWKTALNRFMILFEDRDLGDPDALHPFPGLITGRATDCETPTKHRKKVQRDEDCQT